MSTDNSKGKHLTDEEIEQIKHLDADQVFGNNDQALDINIEEREESEGDDDPSRRQRDIAKEAERVREKLDRKSNDVRDYNSDAREIPM
jgi:hypothetical protein